MALSKLEIDIEGEIYCLDKIPDENSAVVKQETEKLLGALDLKTLVDDLGRVGSFIRIAYNGVGAAGPKFTDNQIEIQRLGYDVTKLCDKSALTVAKFKKASSSILTDLQSMYEYLLDNLEEMALETLSAVSKLTGEMQEAAIELNKEFVQEEEKVKDALEKTQKARGAEAMRIKEMQKECEKMELEKNKQEQLMEEHKRVEEEAEARCCDLELKEDQAISDLTSDGPLKIMKRIINGFTSRVVGVSVFEDNSEKQVEALRNVAWKLLKRSERSVNSDMTLYPK